MKFIPTNPEGRPRCLPAYAWALRFGLNDRQQRRNLNPKTCWQLAQCRSDEARRLLLGVSR